MRSRNMKKYIHPSSILFGEARVNKRALFLELWRCFADSLLAQIKTNGENI